MFLSVGEVNEQTSQNKGCERSYGVDPEEGSFSFALFIPNISFTLR